MQKRSHKLLAVALLHSRRGFGARRYEWAFLFGSVQPDCNPFTFLRGSFRARTFGGHRFSNSQHYIHTRDKARIHQGTVHGIVSYSWRVVLRTQMPQHKILDPILRRHRRTLCAVRIGQMPVVRRYTFL